jgi:hypothetical protein
MESCRIRKVKQKKGSCVQLRENKKKDPACNLGNRESHTKKKTKNPKGIGNN